MHSISFSPTNGFIRGRTNIYIKSQNEKMENSEELNIMKERTHPTLGDSKNFHYRASRLK